MTLIISTLTSSGIVISADSRQTYRNNAGAVRVGSDSATKLFKLTDRCGVAIAGRAFINEDNKPAKDVGYFIKRFVREEKNLKESTVKEITEKLNKYLGSIFIENYAKIAKTFIESEAAKKGATKVAFGAVTGNCFTYSYIEKDGKTFSDTWCIESISLIVAGVDKDGVGRAYSTLVPNAIATERNTGDCGAMWAGQTDVIMRIIKGYAPEAGELAIVKDAVAKDPNSAKQQIDGLEYFINWGTITLQDAVDFCVLMTRTTESIQRFSDGTLKSPGGITGVGGEIDVAVITSEHGFKWVKRKRLKADGEVLLLDED